MNRKLGEDSTIRGPAHFKNTTSYRYGEFTRYLVHILKSRRSVDKRNEYNIGGEV